jgi:hypothetical protein
MDAKSNGSAGPAARWVGPALLGAWLVFLWLEPEPRPLGAPEWTVAALRACTGLGEPAARLVATLGVRATGLALLGALTMQALGARVWNRRSLAALLCAPLLAIAVLWANLGYFPIALQLELASLAALTGAVARLALARRPATAIGLALALAALFAWATATGIRDELDNAARAVGRQLLDASRGVPDGEAGHARLLELAFGIAAADSQGQDPVLANRAAILALAVILGGEQIAAVARRDLDPARLPEARALSERIALQGRNDWPRHFWVSAGLALLSDAERSIAVGLAKELMDATPGGSGFSFSDLAADAAGNRFTRAATRDEASARALQARIRAGLRFSDFVPELRDLPEGLSREQFQERYGGLGGAETARVVEEITRRLAACPGLQ